MSILKKLAGETAIYGVSSIVGRFLNFLLTPFYTYKVFQELGSQYGMVTELYAYVVFFLIFLTFGMETGYFRFMQDDDCKHKVFPTITTTLLVTSSVFVALIFLFINPISSALQYDSNKNLILLLSIVVAIDAFSAIPFAKLRQQSKAKRFALLKVINIGVNIGCNLLFFILIPSLYDISWVKEMFDVENLVVYVLYSNLIASIVTLLLLLPEFFSEKWEYDFSLIKKILPYSIPIVLAGLAGQTNEMIDRTMLKYLIPVPDTIIGDKAVSDYVLKQVGVFGANFKLAVIITLFIQAFRYAFEPMFFKQGKGDDQKKIYAKIMNYFLIFALLMFLGISVFIDVFQYFIGANYREGLIIVPIILMSQVLLGILFNLSLWYKLTDKTHYGILITGIGAVVTISSLFILVPMYGYIGAAWTHVICYVVIICVSYFLGQKHYNIPYDVKSITLYFGLAIVLFFVDKNLHIQQGIASYALKSVMVGVFVGITYLNEKRLVKLI